MQEIQQEKLTLTQLQRYLPLQPPSISFSFPEGIQRYLMSSSFNNFSLKQQSKIKSNLKIAYRNYFQINQIVKHLSQITNNKFTDESIQQAICNTAQKYQLIDWYHFVRIVIGRKKIYKKIQRSEAANIIIAQYRIFIKRKRILHGRHEVQLLKQSMEQRLIKQFGKEALNQIIEFIERNRVQMQEKFYAYNASQKINYIELQKLVNQVLDCSLDSKKIKYLYLKYDYANVGWFELKKLTSVLFAEKKVISVPKQTQFLKSCEQLLEFIRKYTKQLYYSSQELQAAYLGFYHGKTISTDSDELHPYQFYLFLRDKCENKLSYLQARTICSSLKYTSQLLIMFQRKSLLDIWALVEKISMKKQRKRILKKENQVFYSFRKILLILLSKCRSDKLTRQQFTQTVVAYDPSLKYNAFYCVWRVYGGLINIDRMRKDCRLNPLACHFKLNLSDDGYDKLAEKLLEEYPVGTEVTYSKVQERINLQCQFILETLQMKPLRLGDYDLIDYRKAITKILPLDFEITIRSYIFRKVSQKFIVLWRSIKKKRQQKKQAQFVQSQLLSILDKQKTEKDTVGSKQRGMNRKLTNNRSMVSLASRTSTKSKKQLNPQHLDIVKSILEDIFSNMKLRKDQKNNYNQSDCLKTEVVLACKESYTFRSILTKICFNPMIGAIAKGKDFLQLAENRQTQLDIKIPYKPGVQVIDFTTWNNTLAIFTSYNTLQLYSLGQSNSYPFRTVQFPLAPQPIENNLFDRACSNRFLGKYPIILKPYGKKMMVSLLHTKQIFFINEDPTVTTSSLTFNFADHFYPRQLISWIQVLRKSTKTDVNRFVEALTTIIQDNRNNFSIQSKKNIASIVKPFLNDQQQCSQFQLREVFNFCSEYSLPVLRTMLLRECGIKLKLGLPTQLIAIVKLVLDYMRQNNRSLQQMIQQITIVGEQVGLREFKNYLMRVAYQQFLQFQKEIDRYLRTLTRSKTIEYTVLADLLGQSWPYSLSEKPHFIINDFAYLGDYNLLFYTLNGFSNIFVRDVISGKLIAKLVGHNSTPIFYLLENSLILASVDAVKIRGQPINMKIWRLQQDLIQKYSLRPPWIVSPFYEIEAVHDDAATSIIYLSRAHKIVTTSLDSTLKIWKIENPFSLIQLRRIYSGEHFYLSVEAISFKIQEQIEIQYLVTSKVSKQISTNNIYRYQTTAEVFVVETIHVRATESCKYLQTPLKVQLAMVKQGQNLATRKKVLQSKFNYNQIQSLTRATLTLQSLDRNIYNSLKNAFIFQDYRQLRLLSSFLSRSDYAQQVFRKSCEDYGLNILSQTQLIQNLEAPPNIASNMQITGFKKLQFSSDIFEEIYNKILKNSTNKQTIIQIEMLKKLLTPYLAGENLQNFEEILKSCHQKNDRLVNIGKFKQCVRIYNVEGQIPKFYSALRSLIKFLKQKRLQVWQLFSTSKRQLERCKKVRKADFAQYLSQAGFSTLKLQIIVNFLNRNGTISLFQFLHFVRIAIEDGNHSTLMPNYSSLLMTQSQLQTSQFLFDKQKQQVQMQDSSLSKSYIQQQIQQMINRKSSKLSSISQQEEKQRGKSSQKPRGSGDEDGHGVLINSTSRGSLSRDITYTKDTIKREAIGIVRNLQQLLRNEGKSLWQLLALAVPEFITNPVISEAEYFHVFSYLKTPFLLKQKLQLLKYMKRQANGLIDLNTLFQVLQNATLGKHKTQGQKHIISLILEKLEELSQNFDQAIQIAFYLEKSQKQLQIDQLTFIISQPPFSCSHFALKQFEQILLQQKKLRFANSDLRLLFTAIIDRHRLKVQFNKLNLLSALRFKIDKKGEPLRQIFPKAPVDLSYFIQHTGGMLPQPVNLQRDYHNIIQSIGKVGKQSTVKWQDFIRQLEKLLGKFSEETSQQLQASRKFVKQLQIRKMSLLEFFLGLDRSRKFYVTQQQLLVGMAQFNISYDLWVNIKKKHPKRLYYYELIDFLQTNRIINYKTVDSQVQLAMQKFTRRYLRNEDVQTAFNRIKADPQKPQIGYEDFRKALKMVSYFSEDEVILLFSLFVREGVIKQSRDGNQQLLRDPNNLNLHFGFKRFSDVIGVYRAENITKTVSFRFYDYLKKRNISLLFEYRKWLERSKKLKQVAEALKKDKTSLSKQTFLIFLNQIKGGLNEKQLIQLVNRQGLEVDFQIFSADLERIYRKGTLDLEKQEAEFYLKELVKKIGCIQVSLDRLFRDFSEGQGLNLAKLNELCNYVQLGLNKIQTKKLFGLLNKQKSGTISFSQFMEGIEEAREELDRDSQDYRFDFIIEKLMLNPNKYVLKNSKVLFSADRARIIFDSVLNAEEAQLVHTECLKDLKKQAVNQEEVNQFVKHRAFELRMRLDKKDRELIAKLLNYFKKLGIQIEQAFSYLSRHTTREELRKQQFILLLQTLQLKCDLAAINSLFTYFEEGRRGLVSRVRWEQKLQLVQLQQQIQTGVQSQDLRLFYKVKLFLAEVYLVFVRKSYKQNQIYHYFDIHSNGRIAPDELMRSFTDLGITPDPQFSKKIVNYLDRLRQGTIQVAFLTQQLQQCLSSKMRLVLHTKTSRLFQEKANIFKEKAAYFIEQLSERQQLVEINGSIKSCIYEHKFIDLMRQFGCPFNEDQAQDVRRNFIAIEGYLYLYPIYMAFANLFKEGSGSLSAGQADRLRRLFEGMIRHNYSLEELQHLNSYEQLYNFIEQVASFTPVDIKLILTSCSHQGSRSIDVDMLRAKIRNIYLSQENEAISESFVAFSGNAREDLLTQLRQRIDLKVFAQTLGSTKGLIDLETFEGTLQKMSIGLTKGVAKRYFELFSEGKDRLNVVDLLQIDLNENKEEIKNSLLFKSFMTVKSQESKQTDDAQLISTPDVVISQHIAKSLSFKQSSLNKQLCKYFYPNFGFVSYHQILAFLEEIGINLEEEKEEIQAFLQKYSLIFNHHALDKQKLIKIQFLQNMILQSSKHFITLEGNDIIEQYKIQNSAIVEWLTHTDISQDQIYSWIKQEDNSSFSLNQLFRFLCKKTGRREYFIQQFIRTVPIFIDSFELFLTWYHGQQSTAKKQLQQQNQKPQLQNKVSKNYFELFMQKNPIINYERGVNIFCNIKLQVSSGSCNLQRLAAILLYQQMMKQKHMLQVKSNLINPQKYDDQIQIMITHFDENLPVKVLGSLTIDEEKEIDNCGLLLINQKYHGFQINYRQQFQNMATTAYILDPSAVFLKTKNFYLWQPNTQFMPKGGLNYRWSFIPSFARVILEQISKIHKIGYCLPHLRWKDLNRVNGIGKTLYPCQISKKGLLRQRLGWKSLDYQDAYCPPQFLRSEQQNFSFKCDTWIFGCILYEFIYSHPPLSFLSQLQAYASQSNTKYSLAQLLQMPQLPSTFSYKFYNEDDILSQIILEHEFRPNLKIQPLCEAVKRQQSLKGLLNNLQILYGENYRYFKQQFILMEELNNIIYDCLNPNPTQRPTIESILNRKIFLEVRNIEIYKTVLCNHITASSFYQNIIEPVNKIILNFTGKINLASIQRSLERLQQNLWDLLNMNEISDEFILPKGYPWPNYKKGIYSESILKYKQQIVKTNNFNILTLLFNSSYFDMIVFLLFVGQSEEKRKQQCLRILMEVLNRMLIMFKEYNNASCGFVEVFIDLLLKILYEEPLTMIRRNWLANMDIQQNLKQSITNIYERRRRRTYLRPHNFKQKYCQNALRILEQICYLTGEGNIQYLPIRHYVLQNQRIKQLLEMMHCHVKLIYGRDDMMMINYFRDRIQNESKFILQLQYKIQIDFIRFLSYKNQLKSNGLIYYKDIINLYPQKIKLLSSTIIYLYFTYLLRDQNQNIENKIIVLEIIAVLVNYQSYCKKMNQPSVLLLHELIRLMVQPPKTHALHEEYMKMQPFLWMIAKQLNENSWGEHLIRSIDNGMVIVQAMIKRYQKYDMEGELGYESILKNE